jgi:hypothetical protein
MAKKAAAKSVAAIYDRRSHEHHPARRSQTAATIGRPSALLDTRVIYCGDNLEQPGRRQKEEGRMLKPARFPLLHSSFILLPSPVTASHYVKVMLDQIFKEYEHSNIQNN